MKQGSLTRRIILGFALVFTALAAVTTLNALVMSRTIALMDRLIDQEEGKVREGEKILYELSSIHRVVKNLLLSQEPEQINRYTKRIQELDSSIQQRVSRLEHAFQPPNGAFLLPFRQAYGRYFQLCQRILELSGQNSNRRAALLSRQEAQAAFEQTAELFSSSRFEPHAPLPEPTDGPPARLALERQLERDLFRLQRAEKNMILAPDEESLAAIEEEFPQIRQRMEQTLQELSRDPPERAIPWLHLFNHRWQEYLDHQQQVRRLARQNSNMRAFELSTGEGRQRLEVAEEAMQAVVAEIENQVAAARDQAKEMTAGALRWQAIIAAGAILLSGLLALFLVRQLTSRVKSLSGRATAIAQGINRAEPLTPARDELVAIDQALNEIARSYTLIAEIAAQLAEGALPDHLAERSREDLLIRSINRIVDKSRSVMHQVQAVARGNLDQVIQPGSEQDLLSVALAGMTETLRRTQQEGQRRLWMEEGVSQLHQIMRAESPLPLLADRIVTFLCRYLKLQGGILYWAEEEKAHLRPIGGYLRPTDGLPSVVEAGRGIAGQAATTLEAILLEGIAEERLVTPSGFGLIRPGAILALPLLAMHHLRGVLELAAPTTFSPESREFLDRITEAIAITLDQRSGQERLQAALDEARALTRQLAEANRRLGQSDQYKSQFLATMSHEIRTPMNGILGTLQLLEHTRLEPIQQSHLATITRSARGMLTLLNDILDLAKVEAGQLTLMEDIFSPTALLEEVVALFLPVAREKGLTLTATPEPTIPSWLRGDPGRLRQILLNLVGNAIKFTFTGSVTLHIERHERSPHPQGVRLRFMVRDSGLGIAADDLERIFQPFVQADFPQKQRLGGTGLGLTICQRLVQVMGGTMGVESHPGEGSLFWFDLIFPVAEAPLPPPKRFSPAPLPQLALRVLVVEDEETNRTVAQGLLALLGCTTTLADNGDEALQLLQQHAFDVVLLDIQLPGLDGYEVARRIRRLADPVKAHCAILAVTALTQPQELAHCLAAGMNAVLVKPLFLEALVERLTALLPTAAVSAQPDHWPTTIDGAAARLAMDGEAAPILNPARLRQFIRDLTPSQVERIVTTCQQSLQQGREMMTKQWESRNLAELARSAHRLQSAAGANGLERLGQWASRLEQCAKRHEVEELPMMMAQIQPLVEESLAQLETFWQKERPA